MGSTPTPQKEVVPSDLISSLALYRHARHGALRTKAPDVSPLRSPMAVFSSRRINASWLAACCLLSGTGCSERPFARPQQLPPLGDLHSGVKAPSLLLRFLPDRFRARSALRLHYRFPDCAGCGRFTAWGPLHFHYLVRLAAPTVSTPLRDFYVPRDQSVQPRLLPAGPPDEFARFPLAPRRPF